MAHGTGQSAKLLADLTPEQQEYLNMVKTSADSLLTIINDILDFSKIEAGKLELDNTTFSLRDHLEETTKSFAVGAAAKGLELVCDFRPEVPHDVVGDPNPAHPAHDVGSLARHP